MNSTHMRKTTVVMLPTEASSRDMLPNSYPYPSGSTAAAVWRMASRACPLLYPSACCPCTAMLLNRLNRLRLSLPYIFVRVRYCVMGDMPPAAFLTYMFCRARVSMRNSGEACTMTRYSLVKRVRLLL